MFLDKPSEVQVLRFSQWIIDSDHRIIVLHTDLITPTTILFAGSTRCLEDVTAALAVLVDAAVPPFPSTGHFGSTWLFNWYLPWFNIHPLGNILYWFSLCGVPPVYLPWYFMNGDILEPPDAFMGPTVFPCCGPWVDSMIARYPMEPVRNSYLLPFVDHLCIYH